MHSDKILSSAGYPIKFYHGTYAQFEQFRPLSHFGTKEAARDILESRYVSRREVLWDKTMGEMVSEFLFQKNEKKLSSEGYIIPVYLKINRPFVLPDIGYHSVNSYKEGLIFHLLSAQWQTNMPLRRACQLFNPQRDKNSPIPYFFNRMYKMADFLPSIRFIFEEPLQLNIQDVRRELSLETLFPLAENELTKLAQKTDRYHLIFQRMIRFLENKGYDGFVYENETEDKGSLSYVIFRSQQVIRLDRSFVNTPCGYPSSKNERELLLIERKSLSEKNNIEIPMKEIERQTEFQLCMTQPRLKSDDISSDGRAFWMKFASHYVIPEVVLFARQNKRHCKMRDMAQSILFGIECAVSNHVNPLPVILSCALYDYTQLSEEKEKEDFYPNYTFGRKFLLQQNFNLKQIEMRQIAQVLTRFSDENAKSDSIYACAHDAICVWKKWKGLEEQIACITPTGKRLANYSASEKEAYVKAQQQDLVALNIPSLLQLPKYYQYQRFLNAHERE